MSVLSDNYRRIVSEVEAKITNPENQEFVKQKISELSVIFMDVIDNLSNITDQKIKNIEEKQKIIEEKMQEVENYVNDIESDMLEEIESIDEELNQDEDDEYEFEITCPYCDNEFVADINGKAEVKCPECNNIIELDWNDEEETSCCSNGGCSKCPGCSVDSNNIKEYEDNDDDM